MYVCVEIAQFSASNDIRLWGNGKHTLKAQFVVRAHSQWNDIVFVSEFSVKLTEQQRKFESTKHESKLKRNETEIYTY